MALTVFTEGPWKLFAIKSTCVEDYDRAVRYILIMVYRDIRRRLFAGRVSSALSQKPKVPNRLL